MRLRGRELRQGLRKQRKAQSMRVRFRGLSEGLRREAVFRDDSRHFESNEFREVLFRKALEISAFDRNFRV